MSIYSFVSPRTVGFVSPPLCTLFFLHSGRGVLGHLKAVLQLGTKRDKLESEDGGILCAPYVLQFWKLQIRKQLFKRNK